MIILANCILPVYLIYFNNKLFNKVNKKNLILFMPTIDVGGVEKNLFYF